MSAIVVHGGAGRHRGPAGPKLAGVRAAADAGWAQLERGAGALAAALAAVRVLEDDPQFNAGYGSVLNAAGEVEVDAIVMDGATLRFGAVAAVRRVRHAAALAHRVMTDSPHALLGGPGAERFAHQVGLLVPAPDVVAPRALERWRRARAKTAGDDGGAPAASVGPIGHGNERRGDGGTAGERMGDDAGEVSDIGDTVGAVAVDAGGHVAAVTSTGGTAGKWAGRIGDSPIPGAGAYADDETGAVSCTGQGEAIMQVCLAHLACQRLAAGDDASAAADAAVSRLSARTDGTGGLVIVDRRARIGWAWSTPHMPYAWRTAAGSGDGI